MSPRSAGITADREDQRRRGGGAAAAERAARRAVRLEAINAARLAILAHQDNGALSEELLNKLGQELDYEENRLRQALG